MDCLFCSYSRKVERKRDEADLTEIERLIHILALYVKKYNRKILVSWIGGEPFLYPHIFPLSKLCKSGGIYTSTTTNGILLGGEEMCKKVIDSFSEIVFSIDGFAKCHDRIRSMEGAFKKTTQALARLCSEKNKLGSELIVKVNTILLRENIGDFPAFCRYLAELGVNELTFNQLGGFDRPEFYESNRLLENQVELFKEQLPLVKKECAGLSIHGSDSYMERITASARDQKLPLEECSPGRWFWFINENQFISPCSYTTYEYMHPTSFIQNPDDIDKTEQILREMRNASRSRWCDDCHCTQMHSKFD